MHLPTTNTWYLQQQQQFCKSQHKTTKYIQSPKSNDSNYIIGLVYAKVY